MRRFSVFIAILALLFMHACARTYQAKEVQTSGFLEDYSILHMGKDGEALLMYTNTKSNFGSYTKVLVNPVTLWKTEKSQLEEVSKEDQQRLADEFMKGLVEALKTDYEIVHVPGPGVMRIEAAITEAEEAWVTADVVSTIYPTARILSGVKYLSTGTESFVGKASGEWKITDSQTGEILLAGVDKRAGGKTVVGGFSTWDDVEQAYKFWANQLLFQLCQERGGTGCVEPEA